MTDPTDPLHTATTPLSVHMIRHYAAGRLAFQLASEQIDMPTYLRLANELETAAADKLKELTPA
jgi:hypothetical protein